MGDWDNLVFYHWVNPYETVNHWGETKIEHLGWLYDAALAFPEDSEKKEGRPMHFGRVLGEVFEGKRKKNKALLQSIEAMASMVIPEAPNRTECW